MHATNGYPVIALKVTKKKGGGAETASSSSPCNQSLAILKNIVDGHLDRLFENTT